MNKKATLIVLIIVALALVVAGVFYYARVQEEPTADSGDSKETEQTVPEPVADTSNTASGDTLPTEIPTDSNTTPDAIDQALEGINIDDIESELEGIDADLNAL